MAIFAVFPNENKSQLCSLLKQNQFHLKEGKCGGQMKTKMCLLSKNGVQLFLIKVLLFNVGKVSRVFVNQKIAFGLKVASNGGNEFF